MTEKTLVINNDLRIITVPKDVKNLGVEFDEDVLRLHFSMPKMYGNIDLSAFAIRINYLNANGEGDVYHVTDSNTDGDNITFSWLVSRFVTQRKGTVRFIVCLKELDATGKVLREFNTTLTTLQVLEGLETTDAVVQENPDVLENILLSLSRTVKSVNGAAPDENGNVNLTETGSNSHAEYFQITEDGVISLKPEYRGACSEYYPDEASDNGIGVAGSRNAELPEHLVIPEVVGEVAVVSLAIAMFDTNKAVKSVTLPKTINEIPEACFEYCSVEEVKNIENITTMGDYAFYSGSIKNAWMPNLTTLGNHAFNGCYVKCAWMPNLITMGEGAFACTPCLTHAHIGKVTAIGKDTFSMARRLSRLESNGLVTSVGQNGLYATHRLNNATIPVEKLSTLGASAFCHSGWDADWSKLPAGHTKGDSAIWPMFNPTDFWSVCTPTPCENPVPTQLSQFDPRWAEEPLKMNGKESIWYYGCQMFTIMHAYCGLNNLTLTDVDEFVDIVEGIKPGHMDTFENSLSDIKPFCEPLGLKVTEYAEYNQANLQALYDALAAGKYAIHRVPGSDGAIDGHVVVSYGMTVNGKIMLLDSAPADYNTMTGGATYALQYKMLAPNKFSGGLAFVVVEKNA